MAAGPSSVPGPYYVGVDDVEGDDGDGGGVVDERYDVSSYD